MRATLLAGLAAVALAAGPAAAASLHVPIDHSARLSVGGAAASVVVGNPAIADVTVVDSHTLFVSGRAFGTTDVVVLDQLGRTIYSGEVDVGGAAAGQVSVYRGGDRTELSCVPGCQPSNRGKGGGGGGAPASATSAATAASNLGAATQVAHALSPS